MFLLYAYSIEIELNVNAREKIAKINCKNCKNSLKNVKKLEKKGWKKVDGWKNYWTKNLTLTRVKK